MQLYKIFQYLIFTCLTFPLFGQSAIPLERTIRIKIISVDTLLLSAYNTYSFILDKKRATPGRFIVLKSNDNLSGLQQTKIRLCKVTELQVNDITFRGHSLEGGLYVDNVPFNTDPKKPGALLTICDLQKK